MDNLKIFYTKVISDEKSSADFNKIIDDIEKDGFNEEKIQQIISFAKEVGAEISVEDIKNYLESLNSKSETLNETELEMVAGGSNKVEENKKALQKQAQQNLVNIESNLRKIFG